jgi:hypothetical protein
MVVYVPAATLRSAAGNLAGLRFSVADPPSKRPARESVSDMFAVAGRRFAVAMPVASASGPGAAVPWLILAAGLVLAALAGALGVNSTRRAKAHADYDRLFKLSRPDPVADFEGRFTRVNPAVERSGVHAARAPGALVPRLRPSGGP